MLLRARIVALSGVLLVLVAACLGSRSTATPTVLVESPSRQHEP
jgi:hypothetical protein